MLRQILVLGAIIGSSLAFSPAAVPGLRAARGTPMAITMGTAKDGPFTPIVKAARTVLGQGTFTKVRGDVIGYHSKVITAFCETSESGFGRIALKQVDSLSSIGSNCEHGSG